MSDTAARSALERMNLREVAIAPLYSTLAADLRQMALADPELEQTKFMNRRTELCSAYGFNAPVQNKPFAFADGMAIIPISGSLINRFGGSYSGYATGYQFIRRQLALAMQDSDVKGIVFDVNSYGGEAAGCFELSAEIKAASKVKPSIAVIDSNAYSAGYALASAAGKVVCTPSGGAGSIGVVAMHVDMSKLMDAIGYKVTFIHFGEHKVDGNPYEALSPEVKKDIQKGVDKSGEAFVALIATNRGMDAKKVRDTEARVYRAEEAMDLGLIDTVATPNEAMQVFYGELTGSNHQLSKEDTMSKENETQPGADQKATDQAAIDKAAQDARVAERARVAGISGCEEAKGRTTLANHLAMNTDMTVDQAKATLAACPAEAAPAAASKTSFREHMDADKHPNVGAEGGDASSGDKTPLSKADQMFADFAAASGRSVDEK